MGLERSAGVVTPEQVAARRAAAAETPDLAALLAHLGIRAAPLLRRLPHIPEHKALMSVDGGVCPADGAALTFDPWSPTEHRCPRCGAVARGERHDRHWARYQHLWLAERAVELATIGALADTGPAAARARELLTAYAERYLRYPNQDNVLGPSRLFFSTYLESLWILNYLAAAMVLAAADQLDAATGRAVASVADEAANLIGEYDEGFSNRQTWNAAALLAIAVWFEDEDLARKAIHGSTGLVAQLEGYRGDGMWYEGENYHLFALRGLVTGAAWARLAGVDFFQEPLRDRVLAACRAPAASALPDLTFPARKDARFGTSLAQPMNLETWEVALGLLGDDAGGAAGEELVAWLHALYGLRETVPELFDSYLHAAPLPPQETSLAPSRRELSWWALLEMLPQLPAGGSAWAPTSTLLRDQGLAILRRGDRYVSLECGPLGGGHGHADRLHLTLHANGIHWLPDLGTARYVSPDLFWYRSALAHNAPSLDGGVDARRNAVCERYEAVGDWHWVRGRVGDIGRTIVDGPEYVLDIVEVAGPDERVLALPWHFARQGTVSEPGRWEPAELATSFATHVERFIPDGGGAATSLRFEAADTGLNVWLLFSGELLRAVGPGRPAATGPGEREPFYVIRSRGVGARCVAVLEPGGLPSRVRAIRMAGDAIDIETANGVHHHRADAGGWAVELGGERIVLGGRLDSGATARPFLDLEPQTPARAVGLRVGEPPALDGSLEGFDLGEPLRLDLEDQYRRSEEPYPGADEFAARAYVGWDERTIYVAVDVVKDDLSFRQPDAPPLRLDNEPDDIHSDGVQLYVRMGEADDAPVAGYLIVPEEGGTLRVRAVSGTIGDSDAVRGAWRRAARGYCVTVALPWAGDPPPHVGGRAGFDLLVNEMRPGRQRRTGQLVWSGGNGWVWLRGDRQSAARFGVLELLA